MAARSERSEGLPAPAAVAHGGFFAIRTPLLSFDEFMAWTSGLEAAAASDDASLERALAADGARLRERLRAAVLRPEVREALFVASPDLHGAIDGWLADPASERGAKVERTLVRYFVRMTTRATPFGLFAGCGTGEVGAATRLEIAPRSSCRRHTRLDMGYLYALAAALAREPALEGALLYRPNSSFYRAAGRARYVETRLNGRARSNHLVAADLDQYLEATLARAAEGARQADLAAALVSDDIAREEADAYVRDLIASQILVPELAPPLTGPDQAQTLSEALAPHAGAAPARGALEQARSALAALDASEIGVDPTRYLAVLETLAPLPAKAELPRLFQVDLVKSAPEATLGGPVLEEIERAIALLHRIAPATDAGPLARFREAFVARYETREVPLAEVLDDEIGIGFAGGGGAAEAAPLLEGLPREAGALDRPPLDASHSFLLRRFAGALRRGDFEIRLEERDLAALETKEAARAPLPDAFQFMGSLAARDGGALARGDFRLLVRGVGGPSGAPLLGRFCYADSLLQAGVERHLRAEEALEPGAVFAEIAHLPAEERLGNVLARPVLRAFEIPYLARSALPAERRLELDDLTVGVAGARVVLRSRRLGREVIPRLTSAHNFSAPTNLPIYRFLASLQHQGVAVGLGWSWGALEAAPFLPRVSAGRLVLARARWRLDGPTIEALVAARGPTRFRAVQAWREAERAPRLLAVADFDNELVVDLENALSVETFLQLVKGRPFADAVELFPGPEELCARGPEGRFAHEIIVPFVRSRAPSPAPPRAVALPTARRGRSLAPGSDWLFVKLYTGSATADRLLRDAVAPIVRRAVAEGAADRWFFIRYGDPAWHLRVRLRGDPARLREEVLPAFQGAAAALLDEGRLWRLQLDTYEREVERYGGPAGIELAERLFHADSEAALEIVERIAGDEGAAARWRLALRGIDALLDDLGFDLERKRALLQTWRESYARELGVDAAYRRRLDEKWASERKAVDAVLDRAQDKASALAPGLAALGRRSKAIEPVVEELRAAERAGRLSVALPQLAGSYAHMHANRVLRSAQRTQELVIYDFLNRVYASRIARGRAGKQLAVGQQAAPEYRAVPTGGGHESEC
jgi:thiopeptide-type bacteriocin biosynthesis protein